MSHMRAIAVLSAAAISFAPQMGMQARADPVVVELFTSQGCSSCPPADEMLGLLAERDDVIALSLHVDYWDWIGWKDTFADPAFTARQRDYAEAASSSVVYTPQFVIGGEDQVAGPSGMELAALIERHADRFDDPVLTAERDGGTVTISGPSVDADCALILLSFVEEATVKVLGGENAGHQITYHNVVRSWDVVATEWLGGETTFELSDAGDGRHRVVLAQRVENDRLGRIVGAVALD